MNAPNAMSQLSKPSGGRSSVLASTALLILLTGTLAACDFFPPEGGLDGRAPAVEILRPGELADVGGDVVVRVSAVPRDAEDNYVAFVNVLLNGKLLGEAVHVQGSQPPVFRYSWPSTSVVDGEYRIEAAAFDKNQARGLSKPVRIVVRNSSTGEGPATVVVAPRDGDVVAGTVRVIAQRQPGEPEITRLDFIVDGVTVKSIQSAPFDFDWDTTKEVPGAHTLRVRAFSAPDVFKFSDPISVTLEGSDVEDPDSTGVPGPIYQASGISGEVKGSVAIGWNNDLYIGTTSDTLYAFSPSGKLRWKRATEGPIRSSPVVGNNEDIFVTSEDGRLYGFRSTGSQAWPPYNTRSLLRSTPAFGNDGYLYFGDSDGRLHAVNSYNGQTREGWPVKVSEAPIVVPPVIARDRTIFVAATDGYIYAYDPEGRRVLKSVQNVGSISVGMALIEREFRQPLPNGTVLTTKGTMLYAVSNNSFLYALFGNDLTVEWSRPLNGPLRSGPVVGPDGAIYVGTSTGLMVFEEDADSQTTNRLRYIFPAEDVGTPVIDANENIWFVSGQRLLSILPNNIPRGHFDLKTQADGPLTIGRDGRVYLAGNNGIIQGFKTGSVGLSRGKWPMFQRNSRHTGRLGIDGDDG